MLSERTDYDGGSLEIELAGGVQMVDLKAGDLVLYPCSHIHRVATVERGDRYAFVGWIQSLVQDPRARDVLFDLENLKSDLLRRYDRQSPEVLTLDKAIANLTRILATPG